MTNGQEHSILPLLKKAVEEMEASGLTTEGIYRPTNHPRHLYENQSEFEDEAGTIVVNFLQTGLLPQLDKCHAHTIAAIVKKLFLMKGSAIPENSRPSFIQAAKDTNDNSDPRALNRAILELPPASRFILAYLIVHLKRVVAQSPKNKMEVEDIAKWMGPTIIGNSTTKSAIENRRYHVSVVTELMKIDDESWAISLENQF